MTNETMEAMYEHAARHARSAYQSTKASPAGIRESHRRTSLGWARGVWRSIAGSAAGYTSAFDAAYTLASRGDLNPAMFAADRARMMFP